ncbi:MAG: YbhB/YbcL family Raf kinase inhibitor-like protein [Proteobacteria bacterium]|nr:YbhB/YbcL family Raf kinase inhibitor-like protein [Pseudomonadota bacterium]MBU1418173.1 YbhB/YbcL family Raf kinase inhibitor-like protein [Pseudomonadota bacterium]
MKKRRIVGLMLLFVLFAGQIYAGDFVLTSPTMLTGSSMGQEQLFNGFGCSGDNISPELNWSGEPSGTKSFAVTVYDPDAPTGSGWWHWLVFNIPPSVHQLVKGSGTVETGSAPAGSVQARTDFGSTGYGGACPPEGNKPHRYQFTVWALDVETLPLDKDASGAMVGFFLGQHQLGQAGITVYYGR